jgi:protein-disulfide isomerase
VRTGKLNLVFRPIVNNGPFSQLSTEASYCAKEQGYFWQMHNKLYQDQATIRQATEATLIDVLVNFGAEIGLPDQAAFETCVRSREMTEKVLADDQQVRREGIRVQPTFEILGNRMIGFRTPSDITDLIDNVLAAQPSN